jgi:hypothetical protein
VSLRHKEGKKGQNPPLRQLSPASRQRSGRFDLMMAPTTRNLRSVFVLSIAAVVGLLFVQVTFNYDLVVIRGASTTDWSILPTELVLNSSSFLEIGMDRNVSNSWTQPMHATTASSSSSTTKVLHKLLLSVPFYVYEDLVWKGARWDRKPIKDFVNGSHIKHTDDYWFMKNALRHPMRTLNASEAKLFVIPSLHNFYDSRAFFKTKMLCLKGVCNRKLILSAAETVTSSPYFQNRSEAHLAVVSHFAHHKPWWSYGMPDLYKTMLNRSSNIHFEDFKTNDPDRWSAPKLHVGQACPLRLRKTYDVAMIATLKPDDERFRDRETICSWLQHNSTINSSQVGGGVFRVQHCGWGTMCPALADAKLGFHVRGDTPGSSRLFDTLLSGTVPIFTLREQYNVLPDWLNWEQISYFMDMTTLDETTFVRELSTILNDTETYQRKLDLVLANRHLFDWTGIYPFDTYMYMLQAFLYAETRHNPTDLFGPDGSNSILRLPLPPEMKS